MERNPPTLPPDVFEAVVDAFAQALVLNYVSFRQACVK